MLKRARDRLAVVLAMCLVLQVAAELIRPMLPLLIVLLFLAAFAEWLVRRGRS